MISHIATAVALMDELHQGSSYETIYIAVGAHSGFVEIQSAVIEIADCAFCCLGALWEADTRQRLDDIEDIACGMTHWIAMTKELPGVCAATECWNFIQENHLA